MKAHARLYGYLQPALDRFNALNASEPDTAVEFRRALESYTKAYGWLSHVIGFENLELERLYQYGRFLLRRLPAPVRSAGADIGAAVPSHMRITQTGTPNCAWRQSAHSSCQAWCPKPAEQWPRRRRCRWPR